MTLKGAEGHWQYSGHVVKWLFIYLELIGNICLLEWKSKSCQGKWSTLELIVSASVPHSEEARIGGKVSWQVFVNGPPVMCTSPCGMPFYKIRSAPRWSSRLLEPSDVKNDSLSIRCWYSCLVYSWAQPSLTCLWGGGGAWRSPRHCHRCSISCSLSRMLSVLYPLLCCYNPVMVNLFELSVVRSNPMWHMCHRFTTTAISLWVQLGEHHCALPASGSKYRSTSSLEQLKNNREGQGDSSAV